MLFRLIPLAIAVCGLLVCSPAIAQSQDSIGQASLFAAEPSSFVSVQQSRRKIAQAVQELVAQDGLRDLSRESAAPDALGSLVSANSALRSEAQLIALPDVLRIPPQSLATASTDEPATPIDLTNTLKRLGQLYDGGPNQSLCVLDHGRFLAISFGVGQVFFGVRPDLSSGPLEPLAPQIEADLQAWRGWYFYGFDDTGAGQPKAIQAAFNLESSTAPNWRLTGEARFSSALQRQLQATKTRRLCALQVDEKALARFSEMLTRHRPNQTLIDFGIYQTEVPMQGPQFPSATTLTPAILFASEFSSDASQALVEGAGAASPMPAPTQTPSQTASQTPAQGPVAQQAKRDTYKRPGWGHPSALAPSSPQMILLALADTSTLDSLPRNADQPALKLSVPLPARRPILSSFQPNSYPSAAEVTQLTSVWRWGQRLIGLSAQNAARTFVFIDRSMGRGVEEGDVLFQGVILNNGYQYAGTGVYVHRCGRYATPMSGQLSSNMVLSFQGRRPLLDQRCNQVGETSYSLRLHYLSGTSVVLYRSFDVSPS